MADQAQRQGGQNVVKAYWASCTPQWVIEHNACGSTVRRPKLAPVGPSLNVFEAPTYHAIGHEHLMTEDNQPIEHVSGEPA